MTDTRVVLSDTGSLVLEIAALSEKWIDGNDIRIPKPHAKITGVGITPNLNGTSFRCAESSLSWKLRAPHRSAPIVNTIEVESDIAGNVRIAVEDDGFLHIRWCPNSDGATFRDWERVRRGVLRTPPELAEARIGNVRLENAYTLVF